MSAHAEDSYSSSSQLLSIPFVVVGGKTYTNVAVTLGPIKSFGAAPAAGTYDIYDAASGLLFIPAASALGNTYYNVVMTVTLGQVKEVGGSSTDVIVYGGGNLSMPDAIALDGNSDVWVANGNLSGVTRIHPATANSGCTVGCTAYTYPTNPGGYGGLTGNLVGLAVDPNNTVWVPNSTILMQITNAGVVQEIVPTNYNDNHVVGSNVAVDGNGALWTVASLKSALEKFGTDGTLLSSYPFPFGYSSGIAIDAGNNVWVSGTNSSNIGSVLEYVGGTSNMVTYSGAGILSPGDMAADGNGNVWVVNENSVYGTGVATVTEIQNGAPANCASRCLNFSSAALNSAEGLAVDGANNVWVAGGVGANIIKIAPNATSDCSLGCTVLTNPYFSHPTRVAVDRSGNLWVADMDANAVIELLGVAAPTITPLVNQPR